MSRYDKIVEVQKFNPYHGKDGRFTSAHGSGGVSVAGGGNSFLDDIDDDLFAGGGSSAVGGTKDEQKKKEMPKKEIYSELKAMGTHKDLWIETEEFTATNPNGVIHASIYGKLQGGNLIQFSDSTPIKTKSELNAFKDRYAKAKKELEHYYKINYRGVE